MIREREQHELKDFGIEWMGNLPIDWRVTKLKWVSRIVNGSTPSTSIKEFWNGSIPWATPEDLSNRNKYINKSKRLISSKGLKNCGATLVPEGSILMSTRAPIGYTTIASSKFTTNQGCKAIVNNESLIDNEYLYYVLVTAEKIFQSLGSGSTFTELSTKELSSFQIPLPKIKQQKAIASFLDQKTQAIDALIQKKEQLIERMKEKRQALITQAITKGLDPDVPMKDSGIEWLGEIPENRDLKKLKYIVSLISNKTDSTDNIIALENIESWTGEFIETDSNYQSTGTSFKPNDLLFGKLRPYLAKVFLAKEKGNAIGDIYVFRSKKMVVPSYLFMILTSKVLIDLVNSSTYGAKMPRASWDFIGELEFPLPDITEQKQLVKSVKSAIKTQNDVTQKIELQIDKLKEYRQSLISAAVTGKIDVRDEVPVESKEATA